MRATTTHTVRLLRRRSDVATGVSASPVVVFSSLLAFYVVLVPSLNFLPGVGLFNEKRLLQIALLLGMGLVLVISRRSRTEWLNMFYELPIFARGGLLLVGGLGVVSAINAPLTGYALLEVGHYVLLFVLLVGVASVFRKYPERGRRAFLAAVMCSIFLYLVTFLTGYVNHLAGGVAQLWPEAHMGFSNIRLFNHLLTWTLPFVVVAPLMLAGRSRWFQAALFILAALWWMLLLASGGRGTMLAMGVAVIGVGLVFRQAGWPWLRSQLMAFGGGGVLFFLLFKVLSASQASLVERDLSSGSRLEAWGDGLSMMTGSPLLGVGPMHYAYHPFELIWASPHSAMVQWGAEWGVVSLLIMFGLVCYGVYAWLSKMQRDSAREPRCELIFQVAITAALIAGIAHSFVSGIILSPMSQILLVLVIGLAWGLMGRRESPYQHRPKYSHSVLIGVLLFSVVAVAGVGGNDAVQLEEKQAAFVEEHRGDGIYMRVHPRYWQQGFIGY